MTLKKIIAAGTLSTSAMTAYSYYISKKKGVQVREPQLLKKVLKRTVLNKRADVPAWLLHYGVGYLFVTGYEKIWNRSQKPPTLKNGITLGALSGILAIFIWRSVLNATLSLRPVLRKTFYVQLLIAHIIFGATSAIVYRRNVNGKLLKQEDPL